MIVKTDNTDKIAPIALFTYNRLDHSRKTIEALKENEPSRRIGFEK